MLAFLSFGILYFGTFPFDIKSHHLFSHIKDYLPISFQQFRAEERGKNSPVFPKDLSLTFEALGRNFNGAIKSKSLLTGKEKRCYPPFKTLPACNYTEMLYLNVLTGKISEAISVCFWFVT
jgi:hypothetical protein